MPIQIKVELTPEAQEYLKEIAEWYNSPENQAKLADIAREYAVGLHNASTKWDVRIKQANLEQARLLKSMARATTYRYWPKAKIVWRP